MANHQESLLLSVSLRRQSKRTAAEAIEVGKILCVMKEAIPHDEWLSYLEKHEINSRNAAKFMWCAKRFTHHPRVIAAAGSQSKLFELLTLDGEDLAELESGNPVRGLTLEQIGQLSTTKLRDALRAVVESGLSLPPSAAPVTGEITASNVSSTTHLQSDGNPVHGQATPSAKVIPIAEPAAKCATSHVLGEPTELPADFKAASTAFNERVHQLCQRTHRTGAILRLMQSQIGSSEALDQDDLAELVNLLTETLPHHYHDVNDPLDGYRSTAQKAMRDAVGYGERLSTILAAMATIARGDSTLEEMSLAAATVLEIAQADPAYEPDWQTLIDVVESRGFLLVTLEHNGRLMMPSVMTPEAYQQRQKADRAIERLVEEANNCTALSRKKPAPVPRPEAHA